jgi:long-chain fatty acid transport protein
MAGVGGKFAVGKSVDIVADVLYYQWTSVDVFKFFGWEDQTVFKVGAEYRPTDKLALRAGINYGQSPIKGGNRTGNGGGDAAFANYPFPAISESHFTLGLGYNLDKNMAFNAYYLYSPKATETATTSSTGMGGPPAGTSISMSQNAFGVGINYQTK